MFCSTLYLAEVEKACHLYPIMKECMSCTHISVDLLKKCIGDHIFFCTPTGISVYMLYRNFMVYWKFCVLGILIIYGTQKIMYTEMSW